MTKQGQVDNAILKLKDGGVLNMYFHELHWFLMTIERYKLGFELDFNVKISGREVTLTGNNK